MDPKDFVKLKYPRTPELAPDGKSAIFAIKTIDDKKNGYKSALYMINDDGSDYIQFTGGTTSDSSPIWSKDGNHIAFLSSRADTNQLFIINKNGGESQQITDLPTSVSSFRWDNNGKNFLITSMVNKDELDLINKKESNKKPSLILDPEGFEADKVKKKIKKDLLTDPRVITEGYYRKENFYLEDRFSQPFIVSFVIKGKKTIEEENKGKMSHIGEFGYHYTIGDFSLDNNFIFISRIKDQTVSLKSEYLKIQLIDETFTHTELFSTFGFSGAIETSPDGKFFIYAGGREKDLKPDIYDDTQIFLVDLKSDPQKPSCITEDYHRSSDIPRWIDSDTIAFTSPRNGRIQLNSINIHSREVKTIIDEDQDINSYSISKERNKIVYEASHKTFPADIFTCKFDGTDKVRVSNTNKQYLSSNKPGNIVEIIYEREGVQLQGWLMTPYDHDGEQLLPIVLEMHGGPAAYWTPHTISMFLEYNSLVSKGFAIFFCNPRGSDGYGIEFRASVHRNWGEIAGNDIIKGLRTVLDKYSFLDKERIVVTGGSYAGYMTAWLALHPEFSSLFKAAVSQRGVYEFSAFAQTTDIPIWFEYQYEHELLDKERYDIYHKDSPLNNIKNLKCPLLIIHSENDFRVPIVNAEQLFWAGKRYNKNVQFVRYPRDGHELSRSGEPRHIIDRLTRIVNWFEEYI